METAEFFTASVFCIYYFEAALFALLFLVSALILALIKATAKNYKTLLDLCLICLSASFLGTTLGLFIGLSNSPVVGVFVPALLTFCSGLVTYFFISKDTKFAYENRFIVILNLIFLSFFLIAGAEKGSAIRSAENYDEKAQEFSYKIQEKQYDFKLKVLAAAALKDPKAAVKVDTISLQAVRDLLKMNKTDSAKNAGYKK